MNKVIREQITKERANGETSKDKPFSGFGIGSPLHDRAKAEVRCHCYCPFHRFEPLTIPHTHNTGYRAAVLARAQVHGPVDASTAAPN